MRVLAHAIAVTVRPSRFVEKSLRAIGIVVDAEPVNDNGTLYGIN